MMKYLPYGRCVNTHTNTHSSDTKHSLEKISEKKQCLPITFVPVKLILTILPYIFHAYM